VKPAAPDGLTTVWLTHNGGASDKPYWSVNLDNNQDTDFTDLGEQRNMETYCIDIVNTVGNGETCNLLSSTMEENIAPRAGYSDADTKINKPQYFPALNYLHDTVKLKDSCGLTGDKASWTVTGGDLQRATWQLISTRGDPLGPSVDSGAEPMVAAGAFSSGASDDDCVRSLITRAVKHQNDNSRDGIVWRPSNFVLVLVSPITCEAPLAVIPKGQVLVSKYPVIANVDRRECTNGARDPCADAWCGEGLCKLSDANTAPSYSVFGIPASNEKYFCACDTGYYDDSVTCRDIDFCYWSTGSSECQAQGKDCKDLPAPAVTIGDNINGYTQKGWTCVCKAGFFDLNGVCTDAVIFGYTDFNPVKSTFKGDFNLPANYELSMTIKPTVATGSWGNVFRLTNLAGDYGTNGNRVFAIWLYENDYRKMHIRFDSNTAPNQGLDASGLVIGQDNTVVVTVVGTAVTVKVNGVAAGSTTVTGTRASGSVKLWLSDSYYTPAPALVSSLTLVAK